MLFFSSTFLVFFAVVFCTFWYLDKPEYKKFLLLIASYIFYSAWDIRFLSLILFSTLLDFTIGKALGYANRASVRKKLLFISIFGNLGILFFFKYFGFFSTELVQLLTALSIPVEPIYIEIILPVGISFYTFQTLSYTIDVYRRKIKHTDNLLDLAVFVSFFPQLVAGPIVRASDFLPQLKLTEKLKDIPWKGAITLFLIGLFKKLVIADSIAIYIDPVFANSSAFSASAVILAVVLFSVQIYCDFSGYSDMAIALARLLGFTFPLNFSWPYFARNISDFWRRWHISLSSWLRDYLYIALGGNRKGQFMRYRNLMLTMLLGGLWHGASWNFIIWGALHGFALAAYHATKQLSLTSNLSIKPITSSVSFVLTYWWVSLCWIFFRAQDLESALEITKVYLTFSSSGTDQLPLIAFLIPFFLLLLHTVSYKIDLVRTSERISVALWGAIIGVTIACIIVLSPQTSEPFIYFQF